MKKRIVSLALVLFLVAALLPAPALAYDTGTARQGSIVSTGSAHTGFVDENGSLWMWGSNGQLGNGTTEDSSVPVKVLDNVASVSCGRFHTAVIQADGSLWMWGLNQAGQLGNGGGGNASYNSMTCQTVPVKVLGNVAAVSCGSDHTAAIKTDGTLWTWGNNGHGKLGNGTTEDSRVPVKVLDNVAAVSCGSGLTAAVKTDGTLWMWGYNPQLGNGSGGNASYDQTVPVKVLDNVAAVSCGDGHTAAVKTDGTLWTWGSNMSGELGNGTRESSNMPAKVLENVTAVRCGDNHTAAIKTDGTLWTWGDNVWGQLGTGTTSSSYVPVKVMDDVAVVSCGYAHTAAVKTDGTLWMWGSSGGGQLGNGGVGDAVHIILHERFPIQTIPIQIAGLTASLDMLSMSAGPSYSYPAADIAADAMAQEAVNATGGVEPSAVYRLADGLYYILLDQGGTLAGRVVKGVKEQGEAVWKVIQSHDEPADQEELDQLVIDAASTPNVSLDYGRLTASSTVRGVADYLREQLDNMDGLTPNDPAKNALAAFVESALSTLASASVTGPDNRLTVSAETVSALAQQALDAQAALEAVLERGEVSLNKSSEAVPRLLWQDVDNGSPCQVTLTRELADAAKGCALQVLLGGNDLYIQISPSGMAELLKQYGTLSVQISQSGNNVYAVNFLDESGEVLEQIGVPVTIALPASGPLNTVMASYVGGSDNWGGQYDESDGTIAFETRYSGQYEVLENDIAISDIGELDQETRTAIAFLVSKGYMSAPDGAFRPELPLSRYDFTQALVGMFFALDRGLTTSFPDVPRDSGYYAYVASAEADHIVEGYDGVFFGEQNITVEQMLAIAARTLRERKGYLAPGDADGYLSSFADADQVADWAKELAAQTVRDGLIDRTGTLDPKGEVTRARAALILYRLFLRLYEVSPVALELPAAAEVPEATEAPEASEAPAREQTEDDGGFPTGVVIAVSAVVLAGAIGAGAYIKKKKAEG